MEFEARLLPVLCHGPFSQHVCANGAQQYLALRSVDVSTWRPARVRREQLILRLSSVPSLRPLSPQNSPELRPIWEIYDFTLAVLPGTPTSCISCPLVLITWDLFYIYFASGRCAIAMNFFPERATTWRFSALLIVCLSIVCPICPVANS